MLQFLNKKIRLPDIRQKYLCWVEDRLHADRVLGVRLVEVDDWEGVVHLPLHLLHPDNQRRPFYVQISVSGLLKIERCISGKPVGYLAKYPVSVRIFGQISGKFGTRSIPIGHMVYRRFASWLNYFKQIEHSYRIEEIG